MNASGTTELAFEEMRVPADRLLGAEGEGFKVAMTTLGFERGTSATTSHRRFEVELDAIVETARKMRVSLIVMGSHGRQGVERFFLGSVSTHVVKHADRTVMVVK